MKITFEKSNKLRLLILLFVCLIAGGGISVYLGQDANWDLKNYHIYNAWAMLNDRLYIDLFAAGIQTYFNPLLDLPYYLLSFKYFMIEPKIVAFFMGFPFGFLAFFLVVDILIIMKNMNISSRYLQYYLIIIVATIGLTGAGTLSQVGTSFNEIQIAAIILAGITVLLYSLNKQTTESQLQTKYIIIAGVLFGIAAGLKLTASIYAPAAVISLLIVSENWKDRSKIFIYFSLAWLISFLVFFGWWGYKIYQLTGNPFFPMFNTLFHSPWFPIENFMDDRFKPKNILEVLFYPFFWIHPKSAIVAEPIFSDPRLAIGMAILGITIFSFALCSLREKSLLVFNNNQSKTTIFTLSLIVVSYIIWETMFSILRYAVIIEVFSGIIILISLVFLKDLLKLKTNLFLVLSLLIIAILSIYGTKLPEWGRIPYQKQVISLNLLDISDKSLIVLLGPPQAYIAPLIAKQKTDIQFVGITGEALQAKNYLLYKNIVSKILNHQGSKYVSYRIGEESLLQLITEIGLSAERDKCQKILTEIDSNIVICPLQKLSK